MRIIQVDHLYLINVCNIFEIELINHSVAYFLYRGLRVTDQPISNANPKSLLAAVNGVISLELCIIYLYGTNLFNCCIILMPQLFWYYLLNKHYKVLYEIKRSFCQQFCFFDLAHSKDVALNCRILLNFVRLIVTKWKRVPFRTYNNTLQKYIIYY